MDPSADIINNSYLALIVGFLAGAISIFGYRFLLPFLEKTVRLHDTCEVHNLHGMTVILGAVYSMIIVSADYGDLFAPLNNKD